MSAIAGIAPRLQDPFDTVEGIIADIEKRGDAAVLEYSQKFDKWKPDGLRLTQAQLAEQVGAAG